MFRYSHRGFTLLEVMISIAILAIALTVLLGNQGQSLRLAEESRFSFTAALLIREKISELEASGEEVFTSEGDFGEQYPGLYWSVEVDTPDFGDNLSLEGSEQFLQLLDIKVFTAEERQSMQVRRYMLIGNGS